MARTSWTSQAVKQIVVYRSTSTNIWSNLAFEDWIMQSVDLSSRRILFLWRNTPCVVIGRHQNPWSESNTAALRQTGVDLARRRSGGGTVFHDLGNLNCTVFTHRQDYDRPRNVQLACDALNERWNTDLLVNKHTDIICRDRWKVSGTSSRLSRNSAFHHFTLLLGVDMASLTHLLRPPSELRFSSSSATPSRRSDVINLSWLVPGLSYHPVASAIAEKFYDVHNIENNQQVVEIDPTCESLFPGITEMKRELEAWQWNYGKSPKFTVSGRETFQYGDLLISQEFTAEVVHGVIQNVTVQLFTSSITTQPLPTWLNELRSSLVGLRFWHTDIATALKQHARHEEQRVALDWLLQLL